MIVLIFYLLALEFRSVSVDRIRCSFRATCSSLQKMWSRFSPIHHSWWWCCAPCGTLKSGHSNCSRPCHLCSCPSAPCPRDMHAPWRWVPDNKGEHIWGSSSPLKPTLHIPKPLSMSSVVISSCITICKNWKERSQEAESQERMEYRLATASGTSSFCLLCYYCLQFQLVTSFRSRHCLK